MHRSDFHTFLYLFSSLLFVYVVFHIRVGLEHVACAEFVWSTIEKL